MRQKIIDGKVCISRDVIYSALKPEDSKDMVFSWTEEVEVLGSRDTNFSFRESNNESIDTMYSNLTNRLVMLKRPLATQLVELYRDHSNLYRSKGTKITQEEVDLLLEDFRYELHRILAKAKDVVSNEGGNIDNILRLSSFKGGIELNKASKSLTTLFVRIETSYKTFGYIPRDLQVKLNEALGVLVSHFIMDVYGPELERRKIEGNPINTANSKN